LKITVYTENEVPNKYEYDPPQPPVDTSFETEKEASSSSHHERTLKLEARDDEPASPPSSPIRKTRPSSRSHQSKSGRQSSSRPKGRPLLQDVRDFSGIAFCRSRLDVDARSLHSGKSKPTKSKQVRSAAAKTKDLIAVFSTDSSKKTSNRRKDRVPAALKQASSSN
jgi:hypothetical protein